MQRISSDQTFYYKRSSPVFFFGVPAVALIGMLSSISGYDLLMSFLVFGIVVPIVGYAFMKGVIFKLADEVLDAGDALIVRKDGREERVLLADIIGVNYPNDCCALRTPSRCDCERQASSATRSPF